MSGPTPPQQVTFGTFAVDFLLSGLSAAISKTATAPIERSKLLLQAQSTLLRVGKIDRPYTGISDALMRIVSSEGVLGLWRGNAANVLHYFPTQALNFAFKTHVMDLFKVPPTASYARRLITNILSGSAAGSMSLLFVYPLDFVRTVLAADVPNAAGETIYKGFWDVVIKTLQNDGITGFYRGFVVSCGGIILYRALYFGLYDSLKPTVNKYFGNGYFVQFVTGWFISIAAGYGTYPLDTIRRRQILSVFDPVWRYPGAIDTLTRIVKKEGIDGLMAGANANALRAFVGSITLVVYDSIASSLQTKPKQQ